MRCGENEKEKGIKWTKCGVGIVKNGSKRGKRRNDEREWDGRKEPIRKTEAVKEITRGKERQNKEKKVRAEGVKEKHTCRNVNKGMRAKRRVVAVKGDEGKPGCETLPQGEASAGSPLLKLFLDHFRSCSLYYIQFQSYLI